MKDADPGWYQRDQEMSREQHRLIDECKRMNRHARRRLAARHRRAWATLRTINVGDWEHDESRKALADCAPDNATLYALADLTLQIHRETGHEIPDVIAELIDQVEDGALEVASG